MKADFHANGYAIYPADPQILKWAKAATDLANKAVNDPDQIAKWLQCQGTWFVGVDALETGPDGQAGAVNLAGSVVDDLEKYLQPQKPIHRAQLSVVYPGYPKPREGESHAAFKYRLNRDAAHLDGLHAVGDDRRRKMVEYHAYLLGIPLNVCSADASPLVVWAGSHKIVNEWLHGEYAKVPSEKWPEVDLTESYQAVRRRVFEECTRVELAVGLGECVLVHRHMLHGVAPWGADAKAPPEGRMIAYFRPEIAGSRQDWLNSF